MWVFLSIDGSEEKRKEKKEKGEWGDEGEKGRAEDSPIILRLSVSQSVSQSGRESCGPSRQAARQRLRPASV